jgi:hypothetical protein
MMHAAAEVLTIGGLAFVFHRRLSAAETKLEEVETKLALYEKHITNQQRGLESVYQILKDTLGDQRPLRPEPKRVPPRPFTTSSPASQPPSQMPSLSGEDLDNMLKEELGEVVGEEPEELVIGGEEDEQEQPRPRKKAHTSAK